MADTMDVVEGTPPPAESSDASAVRIAPGFRSMVHLTEGADSPASSAPASPAPFVDSVLPSSDVERPPSEKVERLEAKLARDPYDEVTWTALIGEAVNHNEAYTKSVFERMVAVFPTSGPHWLQYIEHESRLQNWAHVEDLFQRCLLQCFHVDVWRAYIAYVTKAKGGNSDSIHMITDAYEFALKHIGLDIDANKIYHDYIQFVKSWEPKNAYETQQQNDKLRDIYSRVVVNPVGQLDVFWPSYNKFEMELNKTLATKLIKEKSPRYMTARAAFKARKDLTDAIKRNFVPRPLQGTESENQQLTAWQQYIAWERTNPLTGDAALVTLRVLFAYQQATTALRFFAEIWYEAAMYMAEVGKPEQAVEFFKGGIKALPDSLLLHFTYAEFEEGRKQTNSAKAIYEALIDTLSRQYNALRERKEALESLKQRDRAEQEKQLAERLRAVSLSSSLTFITYMRFARRALGVKPARLVFSQARKLPQCTYHVYVAAALMELHMNKEQAVATKIFDLGFNLFAANNPEFVMQYLDYLTHLNDDANTRAVFERALNLLPADQAREVMRGFHRHEALYGDLTSIIKLERRLQETYADAPIGVYAAVERYRFLDLAATTPAEAQLLERRRQRLLDRAAAASGGAGRQPAVGANLVTWSAKFPRGGPRPETDKMNRFNAEPPGREPSRGVAHLLSNRGDPLAQLLDVLPPAHVFPGPFVNPEAVIEALVTKQVVIPLPRVYVHGAVDRVLDAASSKRRAEDAPEDLDAPVLNQPPKGDVFRLRRKRSAVAAKSSST